MRWIATAFIVLLQSQSYPPPFPRPGATALINNDRVQVWNVSWPKGQPTPLHRHVYDMVGVYYTAGDRMITGMDGSKRPVSTKPWNVAWQLKGVTHVEEGTSDRPLRAVMVELKRESYGAAESGSEGAGFPGTDARQLLDNNRVSVWDISAKSSGARAPHRHRYDAVVAAITGQRATAVFVPRGTVHNDEGTPRASRMILFELK